MQCTTESRAQFWDSRKPGPQDDWLDDAQLVIKLPVISTIWSSDPKPSDKDASILLVTSTGDPMDNSDSKLHPQPLNISLTLLERLVETSQLSSPYTRTVLATRGFHMSHHLQYGAADGKPSGVTVLFRFPRNSSSITCVLRLRLADYACVCLLFCRDDQVLHDLRRRFTEEASLLRRNPLHILTFVFAHRKETFDKWLKEIAYDVSEAETASGMVPLTWKRSQLRPGRLSHLQDLDKPNLLSHLFSTHTRLCHSELVAQYGIKFGKFCLEVVDMVERYRTAAGFPETRLVDRSDWEEAIRFTLGRWELVQDKVSELLQRLRGQCDVGFRLIAQRESKINRRIAQDSKYVALLAAQDSKTMKTIAIVTLVFLPATLTTGIWSAGIFQIQAADLNWKIFIVTTIAATLIAFSIWAMFGLRPLPPPPSIDPDQSHKEGSLFPIV